MSTWKSGYEQGMSIVKISQRAQLLLSARAFDNYMFSNLWAKSYRKQYILLIDFVQNLFF